MTDAEFEKKFPAGQSLRMAGQRFAIRSGRATRAAQERYAEKICTLRTYLYEKTFSCWSEFLSFWGGHRGYVEAAVLWSHGGTYLQSWMRSSRNELAVRMCIVNLHARLTGGSTMVPEGCRAGADDPLIKTGGGLNACGMVIMLDTLGGALTPVRLNWLIGEGRTDVLALLQERDPTSVPLDDVAACLFRGKLRASRIRLAVEFLEARRPGLLAEMIVSYLARSAANDTWM